MRTKRDNMPNRYLIGLIAFLISSTNVNASEAECSRLKSQLAVDTASKKTEILNEIDTLIKSNEPCAKNLLGRIYFEGILLSKDTEKAHAIFYDLSQQSYPPAFYNLAYLSIRENRALPTEIMPLLHGIMVKYLGDSQWGYLSASARELGWDYLDSLSSNQIDSNTLRILKEQHKLLVGSTSNQLADIVKNQSESVRNQSNTILQLILIGVAAASLGNVLSGPNTFHSANSTLTSTPHLYQFTPTSSSNILYMIPLN